MMAWIVAHSAWLMGLAYVIINEVIALNPNLAANSIVQIILPFLKPKTPSA